MQGRGTAHFHAAVHVKGAPRLDVDSDEMFIEFADQYVKCVIPDEDADPQLYQLVITRQIHHHTRTCTKKVTISCRFHYPRPPSPQTVLARVPIAEDGPSLKRAATQVIGKMFDAVQSCANGDKMPSYQELLDKAGISDELYQRSLQTAIHRTHLVMKRSPEDLFVNNYNPVLLKCLRSNMDIQLITSIWACIAYITSYICKPEKTMSELMQKASKEANDKGVTDKLYHIANQLRKGREVSHHEAIMRCLSMPFRRSNVPVKFIATDFKENRTRIIKQRSVLDTMDDEDSDIYMTTIHDRYAARPNSLEQMSFADFVANYRLTSSSSTDQNTDDDQNEVDEEVTDTVITLRDGLGRMSKRKVPQVIRYHYVSQEKDEEAYFHRLLLLYQPWRTEGQLKTHTSYKESFEEVKEEIVPKIKQFESFHDDVELVLENFDPDDMAPEAWEDMMANVEQEKEGAVEEDPNYQYLNPDNLSTDVLEANSRTSSSNKSFSLTKTSTLPDNDFYKLVQSLNVKQRLLFDFIYCWATATRLSVNVPDPFHIFLSGGGGVGKSHLINAIYEGVSRALRTPTNNPDLPTVLLTASTGKAAVNINGTTLHSAFSLPTKESNKSNNVEYKKPGTETLNRLRSNYMNVKLIIADEISMFGARSLLHLHLTLQHIFEIYDEPFAGISILAVGDLLQLNPVGDLAVFKNISSGYGALAGSLWGQLFQLHELSEIVRQKNDPTYADILSRIRVGVKSDNDMSLLNELQDTDTSKFPESTVKIFLTNQQVANFNAERMEALPEKITIRSKDTKRDTTTNMVPVTIMEENIYKTGGLPSVLTLAKNCKAMITKNIDIADRLVNGVIGTVNEICVNDRNPTAGVIYMKFGNPEIGRQAMKATPPRLKGSVPIKAVTMNFSLTDKSAHIQVERTMFPMVAAFGITAHKSQGSTYDHVIGDLTIPPTMKSVMPGQLYTILSRATSRKGLKLIDFSPDKIKVNDKALQEMERMRNEATFDWVHPLDQLPVENTSHIGFLNIRSLNLHFNDMKANTVLQNLTSICLTETHTKRTLELPGYHSFNKPTQHGLAQYHREASDEYCVTTEDDLQLMARIIDASDETPTLVAVTYRAHDMTKKRFLQLISDFIQTVPKTYRLVLGGDFNLGAEDQNLQKMCQLHGLHIMIDQATQFHGNNLDQILTTDDDASSCVFPLPYTDHFLTCISLQ